MTIELPHFHNFLNKSTAKYPLYLIARHAVLRERATVPKGLSLA